MAELCNGVSAVGTIFWESGRFGGGGTCVWVEVWLGGSRSFFKRDRVDVIGVRGVCPGVPPVAPSPLAPSPFAPSPLAPPNVIYI